MIGSLLAHYRVTALLGAGGMGEVYRAHDESLERDVALKVLPEALTADATARERLIREAKAAAALSHRNICTVHEVGEAEGRVYIAMELVEGQTLSERCAGGPLPVENLIRYGAQIADALAHAHERHVIHRDLKSANVVITADGWAKVLDFGLAQRAREGAEGAPPKPPATLTQAGAVVGTPQYLAPEVLRGAKADERNDLWALGCVLYEMATGALPFRGDTEYELAAAILNETPRPLPARMPVGVRAVTARCLAKQPGERYQTAREVQAALEALQSDSTLVPHSASEFRPPRVAPLVAPAQSGVAPRPRAGATPVRIGRAVLALVVLAALVWFPWSRLAPKREPVFRQLTTNSAELPVITGALSPDGKQLMYLDSLGFYVRDIESGATRTIPFPEGQRPVYANLDWFPDGARVAAVLEDDKYPLGRVWVMSLKGEAPRGVAEGLEVAVTPDGAQIAVGRWDPAARASELSLVAADGSQKRLLLRGAPGEQILGPSWSPDGKRLAFVRGRVLQQGPQATLECLDLASGRSAVLLRDSTLIVMEGVSGTLRWMRDGRLLFVRQEQPGASRMSLWAARVDPAAPRLVGRPRLLVRLENVIPSDLRASADGKRLSLLRSQFQAEAYVAALDARRARLGDVRRLTFDDRDDYPAAWSGDGKALFVRSSRSGHWNLFRQSVDARRAEPVVTTTSEVGGARLSPDGAWLLYFQWPAGHYLEGAAQLMRQATVGGGAQPVLEASKDADFGCAGAKGPAYVLGDLQGERLVFTSFTPEAGRDRVIAQFPVDTIKPHPWALSPDGRRIAVMMNPGGTDNLLRLVETAGGTWRDVKVSGNPRLSGPVWTKGGDALVAVSATGGLVRVGLDGRVTPIPTDLIVDAPLCISPDGKRLAFAGYQYPGNMWVLEGF